MVVMNAIHEEVSQPTVLNDEAMREVAQHMEPVDLVRFERIRMQWKTIASHQQQSLSDVTVPRSVIQNSRALVEFIRKFGSGIKKMEFSDLYHLSGDDLMTVASAMAHIEDVGLVLGDQLPKFVKFLSESTPNQSKLRKLQYAMAIEITNLQQFIPFKRCFQKVFNVCPNLSELVFTIKLSDEIRKVLCSNRIGLEFQLLQVTLQNIILSIMSKMDSITLSTDAFLVIRDHFNDYKSLKNLKQFQLQLNNRSVEHFDYNTMSNVSHLVINTVLPIILRYISWLNSCQA